MNFIYICLIVVTVVVADPCNMWIILLVCAAELDYVYMILNLIMFNCLVDGVTTWSHDTDLLLHTYWELWAGYNSRRLVWSWCVVCWTNGTGGCKFSSGYVPTDLVTTPYTFTSVIMQLYLQSFLLNHKVNKEVTSHWHLYELHKNSTC